MSVLSIKEINSTPVISVVNPTSTTPIQQLATTLMGAGTPSKAGQRRLRTETLASNNLLKLGTSSNDIPEEVLAIYRKYQNLNEVIHDKDFSNRVRNATLLIKHHLFKPDDDGSFCKSVLNSGSPGITLDLIFHCLPDKIYLQDNPEYIDELLKIALKANPNPFPISKEIITFLSDREKVKNCPERDAFFYTQYIYETRMTGMHENEYFADFLKRKNLSAAEYKLLVYKLPLIIRRHDGYFFNSFINSIESALKNKNFERASIFLRWNICKVDLNDLVKRCNNPEITSFLRNNGFLN